MKLFIQKYINQLSININLKLTLHIMPSAVDQSDARPPGMRTVAGSIITSGNILPWRFHEIISTTILSLPLIQEGQLSIIGERMCTRYW